MIKLAAVAVINNDNFLKERINYNHCLLTIKMFKIEHLEVNWAIKIKYRNFKLHKWDNRFKINLNRLIQCTSRVMVLKIKRLDIKK